MQTKFSRDDFFYKIRWLSYISDDNGWSIKAAFHFSEQDGKNIALLSGKVSTENNGGFIQIRKN